MNSPIISLAGEVAYSITLVGLLMLGGRRRYSNRLLPLSIASAAQGFMLNRTAKSVDLFTVAITDLLYQLTTYASVLSVKDPLWAG